MRNIATIKENDRKALFQNTAAKMGLTNAIIEKDFWVCFRLVKFKTNNSPIEYKVNVF